MVNSFLRPIKIIERHIWSFSVPYVFLIIMLASESAFLKLCPFLFPEKAWRRNCTAGVDIS
jgi:hypothetical protein